MDPNSQNPQGGEVMPQQIPQDQPIAAVPPPVQEKPAIPEIAPVVVAPPMPSVPPALTEVPSQDNQKKGSPLMIVAIILVVVAIAALILYIFGGKFFAPKPVSTPVAIVTPSPTPEMFANWKTYKSEKYGYAFKYPFEWGVIDVNGNGDAVYVTPQVNVDQINKTNMYPDKIGKIFGSLVKMEGAGLGRPTSHEEFWDLTKTEDSVVDGISVKKYTLTNVKDTPNGVYFKGDFIAEFFIPLKNNNLLTYSLMDGQYISIFDQIFSTFKFTEATPTGSPTISPVSSPSSSPRVTP